MKQQLKIVDFDKETQVKQVTLREILWEDFEKDGKPGIYESNVVEILGPSKEQIKRAFLNNGIKISNPQSREEGEDDLAPEIVVEIGKEQWFEHSQFENVEHIENMLMKYDYQLNDLIKRKGSLLLIHADEDFVSDYPKLYQEVLHDLNGCRVIVFLMLSDQPQILSQISCDDDSAYEFIIRTWKGWRVETTVLERLYKAILYNIMK